RASPRVALGGEEAAITVAVPEFWQQFPKAIDVAGESLLVRLFPETPGHPFELQGGEQKTHTVWIALGEPSESGDLPLAWVHQPVRVLVAPTWYAASGSVPHLPVAPAWGAGEKRLDTLLTEAVSGPESFFGKREVVDEYGWRHYGE